MNENHLNQRTVINLNSAFLGRDNIVTGPRKIELTIIKVDYFKWFSFIEHQISLTEERDTLVGQECWIGLNDRNREGDFNWLDDRQKVRTIARETYSFELIVYRFC